jgi:hypothetical protein
MTRLCPASQRDMPGIIQTPVSARTLLDSRRPWVCQGASLRVFILPNSIGPRRPFLLSIRWRWTRFLLACHFSPPHKIFRFARSSAPTSSAIAFSSTWRYEPTIRSSLGSADDLFQVTAVPSFAFSAHPLRINRYIVRERCRETVRI